MRHMYLFETSMHNQSRYIVERCVMELVAIYHILFDPWVRGNLVERTSIQSLKLQNWW